MRAGGSSGRFSRGQGGVGRALASPLRRRPHNGEDERRRAPGGGAPGGLSARQAGRGCEPGAAQGWGGRRRLPPWPPASPWNHWRNLQGDINCFMWVDT
nr:uncharacterized protein LOC125630234 isoform X8 [Caretta caretta]